MEPLLPDYNITAAFADWDSQALLKAWRTGITAEGLHLDKDARCEQAYQFLGLVQHPDSFLKLESVVPDEDERKRLVVDAETYGVC